MRNSPMKLRRLTKQMRYLPTLVFVTILFAEPLAAQTHKVELSKDTFKSAGKSIRVEYYLPKGETDCPAVVLLHDSAGMTFIPATVFRQCSNTLARKGYAVLLVHYFDGTGHQSLKPEQARKSQKYWPAWRDTIRDGVRQAQAHPRIDRNRIGLLGFSLGAYLSMAVAAEKELKIAAVAEFFGGMPQVYWKHRQKIHLAPTLIVHGRKDQIVPAKEANALHDLLKSRSIPCELKMYDCGHLFKGTQLSWSKSGAPPNLMNVGGDIGDVRDRTLRFFATHLMNPKLLRK